MIGDLIGLALFIGVCAFLLGFMANIRIDDLEKRQRSIKSKSPAQGEK